MSCLKIRFACFSLYKMIAFHVFSFLCVQKLRKLFPHIFYIMSPGALNLCFMTGNSSTRERAREKQLQRKIITMYCIACRIFIEHSSGISAFILNVATQNKYSKLLMAIVFLVIFPSMFLFLYTSRESTLLVLQDTKMLAEFYSLREKNYIQRAFVV